MRFPPLAKWADKSQGVDWTDYSAGVGFERPISLWRTAYSSITQSRADLPDLIGAVTWIAQYAPHHSSFVPVYASADHTPSSLNTGTQFKVDKQANWWVHCVTGNYLSRWYRYTIEDVRAFQKSIEEKLLASQAAIEKEALALMTIPSVDAFVIPKMLWVYHERTATQVREEWWDFFFKMAGTYRYKYILFLLFNETYSIIMLP